MITPKQFADLFPHAKEPQGWAAALAALLPRYGIATPPRLAAFLAQCGHESEGFTHLEENLNYTKVETIVAVFRHDFDRNRDKKIDTSEIAFAQQFVRQPEKLANYAYANQNGNGPEESGDGWKFRGRGCLQVTGRQNYQLLAVAIGRTLEQTVFYLETVEGAVESACWFWRLHNLNPLADAGDTVALTRRINGGLNGLQERHRLYLQALDLIREG